MSFVPIAKERAAGNMQGPNMIKYVITIVLNKIVLLYLNSLQQSLVITAI